MAVLAFFLMPANTVLYDADLAPIVSLPAGYFVMQASADAPDGYIAVAYDDLTGYCKTSDLTAVDYTPVNKYETTVRFTCQNDGQPVNLRAKPKRTAQILRVLENSASGHVYGTATGDALFKDGDTLWYYVSINGVRGYCYYAHVEVDATPPNIIEKQPEPEPDDPAVSGDAQQPDDTPQGLPTAAVIALIVTLCIPVPFIMFYLFRKPKER